MPYVHGAGVLRGMQKEGTRGGSGVHVVGASLQVLACADLCTFSSRVPPTWGARQAYKQVILDALRAESGKPFVEGLKNEVLVTRKGMGSWGIEARSGGGCTIFFSKNHHESAAISWVFLGERNHKLDEVLSMHTTVPCHGK